MLVRSFLGRRLQKDALPPWARKLLASPVSLPELRTALQLKHPGDPDDAADDVADFEDLVKGIDEESEV